MLLLVLDAADVDGVFGAGGWRDETVASGARRAASPVRCPAAHVGDVLVADAHRAVAAAHDLVDQHRSGAVVAHQVAGGIASWRRCWIPGWPCRGRRRSVFCAAAQSLLDVGHILIEDDARTAVSSAI